jgi:hypothetical protein
MIKLPRHDDYQKNATRMRSDNAPCAICGKAVRNRGKLRIIFIREDQVLSFFESVGEKKHGGDGFYPVCTKCVKDHPEIKPYLLDFLEAWREK